MVNLRSLQPDHNAGDARVHVRQVQAHDYNPPKRERILSGNRNRIFPSARCHMNQVYAMSTRTCSSRTESMSTSASSMKNRSKPRRSTNRRKRKDDQGILLERVLLGGDRLREGVDQLALFICSAFWRYFNGHSYQILLITISLCNHKLASQVDRANKTYIDHRDLVSLDEEPLY
jgi:hypothetical protein